MCSNRTRFRAICSSSATVRDKIKILLWQHNGFWLFYRRLERDRFRWPGADGASAAATVSLRELRWLLDGLDYRRLEGHKKAEFSLL